MTGSDSNKLPLSAAGHGHPLVKGRERGLGGVLGGGPFIWDILGLGHLLRDNSYWLCKNYNRHTRADAVTGLVK